MLGLFIILGSLQAVPDTVHISAPRALERALEQSSLVRARGLEAGAAAARADQAGSWANPDLSITAENVGASERFTGLSGFEGLEGQAVVSLTVPLGGDRGGAIRRARALATAGEARAAAAHADVALETSALIAALVRDRGYVESARQELETLDRLAGALSLQADEGRASVGDAARAGLASGMAATQFARRRSEEARSGEELARVLGFEPGTPIDLTLDECLVIEADSVGPIPEEIGAQARIEAAEGALQEAQGRQIPDLRPTVGVRRTDGETGLYLGIAAALPIFNSGGRAADAARTERDATLELRDDQSRRLAAERSAARRSVAALEEAGQRFSPEWAQHLDDVVRAAEARYELGEGTLFELLDSRRARLAALDDWSRWRSELWIARARVARLEGRPVSSYVPCVTNPREGS